ncbi:hypothetical protein HUR95_04635 [Caldalkalibacillus thermarum TA2.A1]|uniref:Uncharacterized protein n=1 Tax=Caldalkalibacillus thermarum (strain TA2.A1) TaxID=986075 RepID=A0A8X8IAM2_CALTT|nr:hypothetical protein [Caldalkalibacillus thermarum]QZT34633.1 hypothetical protein HUR95_04635 [Caldalkalibacillus thermarum TA2.A1]
MELELAYQAIDCGRHSGNHCLRDLYWPELLWAAVSVGKRSHRDWENFTQFSTSSDIHINLFIDDLKNHQKHDKKDIHDEHSFIGTDGIVVQVEKQWYAWQAHLEKVISQNGEDNGCFR